jgi:hypothetical protein
MREVEARARRVGREREEAMERRTSKGREERQARFGGSEGDVLALLEGKDEGGGESTEEGRIGGVEESLRGKLRRGRQRQGISQCNGRKGWKGKKS